MRSRHGNDRFQQELRLCQPANWAAQVHDDVDEVIDKYSGNLHIRRQKQRLESTADNPRPVQVNEVVLVYDDALAPDSTTRDAIARTARRRATSVRLV